MKHARETCCALGERNISATFPAQSRRGGRCLRDFQIIFHASTSLWTLREGGNWSPSPCKSRTPRGRLRDAASGSVFPSLRRSSSSSSRVKGLSSSSKLFRCAMTRTGYHVRLIFSSEIYERGMRPLDTYSRCVDRREAIGGGK